MVPLLYLILRMDVHSRYDLSVTVKMPETNQTSSRVDYEAQRVSIDEEGGLSPAVYSIANSDFDSVSPEPRNQGWK